jgi:hypothetical protein
MRLVDLGHYFQLFHNSLPFLLNDNKVLAILDAIQRAAILFYPILILILF